MENISEVISDNHMSIQDILNTFNGLSQEHQLSFNKLINSITPKRFHNKKLLTVVPESILPYVIKSIESLTSNNPYGLFLQGGVGVGKTCTLYIIYKIYLMYQFCQIFKDNTPKMVNQILWNIGFTTHFDLVKSLREISSENEDIDLKQLNYTTKYVLLIDDLGRGYSDKSGWNKSLLSEFIDYRWSNGLTTYFSSNRTKKELEHIFSPEAIDRIFDSDWVQHLPFEGESFRGKRK